MSVGITKKELEENMTALAKYVLQEDSQTFTKDKSCKMIDYRKKLPAKFKKSIATSAKKHKHLRRKRRTDWERSREEMLERERIAEEQAEKYLKELYDTTGTKIEEDLPK